MQGLTNTPTNGKGTVCKNTLVEVSQTASVHFENMIRQRQDSKDL